MSATMGVVGAGTLLLFLVALVGLYRRPKSAFVAGLLAVGSGLATIWSALGVGLARAGRTDIPAFTFVSLALMGLVTTIFFLHTARSRSRYRR